MKISCQSCQAKYTIADDKVLGKIVKIRCKKCSATIVINGNEATAAAPAPGVDANVFDYTAQGSAEQWTVNVADGDQRTMTSVEVESAYKGGVVNDETFCWKDGMGDWLPLREIEELYAACTMGPRPSLSPDQSHHDAHDEQPTAIQQTNLGSLFGSGGGAAAAPMGIAAPPDSGNGVGALFGGPAIAPAAGAPSAGASAAAAARRAGGRGAQGADLFGGVARAGGEEDVMTSLSPSGMPGPHAPGGASDKMTGQRNENSVLFSLSALSNNPNAPKEDMPLPLGEGSGLIDIRALSGMQPQEGPKHNRADDIMNLGGGGAFTPALSAPILGAPSMEAPDYAAAAAEGDEAADGKNKKTLLIAIIASCSLIAVAILVVVLLSMKSSEPSVTSTTPTGTSTTTATTATATATSTTASTATATETATTATASALPLPSSTTTATTTATTATASATTTATTKPTATASATTTATATATDNSNSPPFNIEAAKNALRASSAAAGGCGKPGGPTGTGSVVVMFRGNGSVQSAQVQGPPFAGTPVGGCVAQRFYGAHIPAFSGAAPPLSKSFTVN